MTREELLGPWKRLLEDSCPPSLVRAIEAGGSAETLWAAIEASGYLDALVPETAGGAGLGLGDVAPLFMALGRFAVPLPVAETMMARALLASEDIQPPRGAIVMVDADCRAPVPLARLADHALLRINGRILLAALHQADRIPTGEPASPGAYISWPETIVGAAFDRTAPQLGMLLAVVRATDIAGAADRVLEMTVAYANERSQFGKPIGRQQAIQQQMAVMAEQVVAARMAAEIGCAAGFAPEGAAAVAKAIASRAASVVADTAHVVHGAIGVSEECDLQLFTRRMRDARLDGGSESYWSERLGRQRLTHPHLSTVDFLRAHINLAGGAA
jgi:acyl-CoA dehydrogenase